MRRLSYFAFWLLTVGCLTLGASVSLEGPSLAAQEATPVELFRDAAPLGPDHIRIGAWNLRHINLESGAADFLIGTTREADFDILIATFGKAIRDLGLDIVAVVELQPRQGEANRLHEIRDWLNDGSDYSWKADQTQIQYDAPVGQFGGLQFGLLWKSKRVTIDPDKDKLLAELRQPRDESDALAEKRMRAPWLIPITAGELSFDLMVLHLKSGGAAPQADEVEALRQWIVARQSAPGARHLIISGDWNIRPDKSGGRFRLRKLMAPVDDEPHMRVLTVSEISPSLEDWDRLGPIAGDSPVAGIVPFTHYNRTTLDTFLDHMAISRTLDEVFDHPVQVTLASGGTDVVPGIRIARPVVSEETFTKLTDHLPVVLTLRITSNGPDREPPPEGLRIVAALPNPTTADRDDEEVHLKNIGMIDAASRSMSIGVRSIRFAASKSATRSLMVV